MPSSQKRVPLSSQRDRISRARDEPAAPGNPLRKVVLARDLFYVNMHLYRNSSNVYDSYAEACLKNGEEELALANYKISFAMDPKNSNAERVIKELEAKKAAGK